MVLTLGPSFWVYQTTQEACFQEMIYKNLSEKYSQLERQVQSIKLKSITALQKAQEVEKLRNHELAEQYAEKGRQFQKLQLMYDKLKRRSISQQTPTEVGNLEVASSMGPIQGFALGAQSYSLQGDMCQPASGAFQRAPSQPLHQQPQLQRRPFTQLMNNHLPNGKGTQSGFVRPQPGLNGLGTTHPGISRPLMQSRSMDGMQMPHPSGRPRTPSISRIENQYAGFGGGPGSANRGRQSGAHQRHHSMQGM
ncbi:hypothetical protein DFJ77DRAFT_510468 [Powellomyces hirtus]|nr:hypothetical protein DFJ77DRAFT_510468 [Powellomyces hirtus]